MFNYAKTAFLERSIKKYTIDSGLRAIIQWIYRDGYCEQSTCISFTVPCRLFAMSHADCSQCPMQDVHDGTRIAIEKVVVSPYPKSRPCSVKASLALLVWIDEIV